MHVSVYVDASHMRDLANKPLKTRYCPKNDERDSTNNATMVAGGCCDDSVPESNILININPRLMIYVQ